MSITMEQVNKEEPTLTLGDIGVGEHFVFAEKSSFHQRGPCVVTDDDRGCFVDIFYGSCYETQSYLKEPVHCISGNLRWSIEDSP